MIAQDQHTFKLDSEPPSIRVCGLSADQRLRVEQGKPLAVAMVVEDNLSGVNKVEVGFNEADGKLLKPLPANRMPDDDRSFKAIVPTTDLSEGLSDLKVHATDGVGTPHPDRLDQCRTPSAPPSPPGCRPRKPTARSPAW